MASRRVEGRRLHLSLRSLSFSGYRKRRDRSARRVRSCVTPGLQNSLPALIFFEFAADDVYDDSKSGTTARLACRRARSATRRPCRSRASPSRVSRMDVALLSHRPRPSTLTRSLSTSNHRSLLDLGDPRPRLSGGKFCLLLFFRVASIFPLLVFGTASRQICPFRRPRPHRSVRRAPRPTRRSCRRRVLPGGRCRRPRA